MRRRGRTDGNQKEIVAALKAIGASVFVASSIGDGFPDLVVGHRRRTYLIELKDPSKPPSERVLTPEQREFFAKWAGHCEVAHNVAEALAVVLG